MFAMGTTGRSHHTVSHDSRWWWSYALHKLVSSWVMFGFSGQARFKNVPYIIVQSANVALPLMTAHKSLSISQKGGWSTNIWAASGSSTVDPKWWVIWYLVTYTPEGINIAGKSLIAIAHQFVNLIRYHLCLRQRWDWQLFRAKIGPQSKQKDISTKFSPSWPNSSYNLSSYAIQIFLSDRSETKPFGNFVFDLPM
jgi:hypothetical protein